MIQTTQVCLQGVRIGAPLLLLLCSVREKEDHSVDPPLGSEEPCWPAGHLGSNQVGRRRGLLLSDSLSPTIPRDAGHDIIDHHDNMSIANLGTIGRAVATSMSPATSSQPMRASTMRGTTTPQHTCRHYACHYASVGVGTLRPDWLQPDTVYLGRRDVDGFDSHVRAMANYRNQNRWGSKFEKLAVQTTSSIGNQLHTSVSCTGLERWVWIF
jgi:hypothetical protein